MKIKLNFVLTATVVLSLTAPARAAVVSFGFTGVVANFQNPSNTLPAGFKAGLPVTGMVTYNTSLAEADASPAATDYGYYNFTNFNGLAMVVQAAGHTFSSFATKTNLMRIQISNNHFGNGDVFQINGGNLGNGAVFVDGLPPAGGVVGLPVLNLSDSNGVTYASDALPTAIPPYAQFQQPYYQLQVVSTNSGAVMYQFVVSIKSITADQQVSLNLQRLPGNLVQVSWPVLATGFTLQSRTNLWFGSWQTAPQGIADTETEHTATLFSNGGGLYFRLKK